MRQLDGLKEKTNEELLAMYDRDRQLEVKQELTLRYLYIAKAVAIQMHNLYADFMQMEDIINEGAIAIMKVHFYRLIEQFYPKVRVLSFNEVANNVQIQSIGSLKLEGPGLQDG